MLVNKTVDELHKEILGNISDDYDKTVGYLTYDATRSFAIEGVNLHNSATAVYEKTDVENLSGDELEKFINQRKGITRKQATKSIGLLEVQGTGTVSIGAIFETEAGTQFKATETKVITTTGIVKIEALLPGAVGNVGANNIKKIPVTISGINSVNNPAPTVGGYEAESDESLLERYYLALRTPPTSGNKYHYLMWAKEVEGVGDARVFPLERGTNTVEVVIIDADKQPAIEEVVQKVQTHIDPDSQGVGEGQAPIGARCYVVSATEKAVNLSLKVTLLSGYDTEVVKSNLTKNITEHLQSIAFKDNYLSYARVGSIILDTVGIQDYTNLTINGLTDNVPVGEKEVLTLGGVTFV